MASLSTSVRVGNCTVRPHAAKAATDGHDAGCPAVKLAGLTGGIGSGKSTVGTLLAQRGAVIVDVDLLSRELQQPGRPVFAAMVGRWGDAIVRADGTLDRQAVADIVFNDQDELAAIHAMTNVPMEEEIYARVSAHHDSDRVVVLEAALFAGGPKLYGITGLLVVDTPDELAVARIVSGRGMRESDARARLANQRPREERLRHADFVIDNSGSPAALAPHIERAWTWLRALPDGVIERRLPTPDTT
jgi:dephospho-CoA kinase